MYVDKIFSLKPINRKPSAPNFYMSGFLSIFNNKVVHVTIKGRILMAIYFESCPVFVKKQQTS